MTVPMFARAMAAGSGGSGMVGPPAMVSIPEAVATLICMFSCRISEKPPALKWLSIVERRIGLSVPVRGSIALQDSVMVTVFVLIVNRSIPWTVALNEAVVSLLSTWNVAVVELPKRLKVGTWVIGSVIRTSSSTRVPC